MSPAFSSPANSSLASVAMQLCEELGGHWSGSKGMARCPAHDDRTPSLGVALGRRAILFHCFAGCSQDQVLTALAARGVSPACMFSGKVEADARASVGKPAYHAFAERIWREARPIDDTPAKAYLEARGIRSLSRALRFHPRTPLGPKGSTQYLPALIAAVTMDHGLVGIHRTFLNQATPTVAPFDNPKRALGSLAAGAVRLFDPLDGRLGLAEGIESALAAKALIYAASAHARDLLGRFEPEDKGCSLKASAEGQIYRQGYFLGDGTGAGKGRQVASVILDRWVRGERRHIWISKNEALLEDARRDWAALGGLPIDIQPLASWKLGTSIAMREGILFVTYPTLRSGRNDATRLDQILAWAGEDFDGVIVFDEAHAMANAAGGEGSRGKVKGSEQGIAGVRLQNLLPRARVLYASATGASDVNNLAYATRLGLWGPETAFANREAFVADIRDGGIAAMELVARDLKSLGLYTARALSFAGVEYEILEHCLTEDQIAIYDAYAEAWAIIHARGNDLFVTIRGRAPHKVRAHVVFVRLARQLGYRGPTGTAGMRLHDLRHTFAVRSLESCPPDREAIAHHMAGLSVYLGHASVANTYWYLEATPVLLRDIAAASEQLYRGEAA